MHRASRRRAGSVLLVLAGTIAITVGPAAAPASAHATLLSTAPVADELLEVGPEVVELQFDESVESVTGGIQVIDPAGGRADRGSVERADGGARLVVPIDGEREGTYTVAWRVLSEDGHNLAGSFVFHVGVRTGAATIESDDSRAVEAAGVVGRWLGFVGLVAAGGASLVAALALRSEGAVAARTSRLAVAGGLVGALGVAVVLVAQAAEASGRGLLDAVGVAPDLAMDTRTGVLTAARGAALLAAAALAALRPLWRAAPWVAGIAVGVGALLSSLAGHAWTAERRGVAVATDATHLLAVVVWIGGLAGLLVGLAGARDRRRLGRRFSACALVAAGVVAASGMLSGAIQLGSLDAVTSTSYGRLLLAKVAGFAILVWMGWINRSRLVPILERTATPLLRSVRVEVVVAVAILGVTAVLVDTPPGRDQLTQPYTTSVTEGDATVQVTVDPAEVGGNDVHLYFYDETGSAPLLVDAVEVTAATGDIPPRRLDVVPVTSSHVSALDATFASPGTWTLQVTAVRAGTPSTYTIEVEIR